MARAPRAALTSAVLLSVSTGACGEILGVDGYSVAPPERGDSYYPLPGLPDQQFRGGCRGCAEEQCGSEFEVCKENSRCRNMLACSGQCSDPSCLAHCADRLPPSPDFEIYFDCVFRGLGLYNQGNNGCSDKCNVGNNLKCVDTPYAWDVHGLVYANLSLSDIITQVQDSPFATIVGGSVTPCSDLTLNPGDGAQGCTGISFPVEPNGDVSNIPFGPNEDAFILRGGQGEQQRLYPRRITGPGRQPFGIADREGLLAWLHLHGTEVDPNKAIVNFGQTDCLGSASTGGDVSLDVSPPILPYYSNSAGVYSQSNPPAPGGVFIDVESPSGFVTVTRTYQGKRLQSRQVLVAPGWITDVHLLPHATDDLFP